MIVTHQLSANDILYSTGSGSSYLYGFFDQAWKEGMTKDEAEVRRTSCLQVWNCKI